MERAKASPREVCLIIVDDDPAMIFIVERLLRRAIPPEELPHILTAQSPGEALRWLPKLEDCLGLMVLSDFNLKADHTGIDLLGFVAHDRPASIRVLMSGSPMGEIPRLDAHPIHDFIPKDTPREEMATRVASWLGKARTAP